MKKLMLILFMLTLISCSSKQSEKRYFQVTSDFTNVDYLVTKKVSESIWIEPVQVATYLDTTSIVYQINEVEYTTATNNLWLTALSDQLQTRLTIDLANLWSKYNVSSAPVSHAKANIKLYIDAFYGSYTGDAVIQGRWVITESNKQIITKKFDYRLPLNEDGYPALVKALSKGFQEEVIDLVRSLGFS